MNFLCNGRFDDTNTQNLVEALSTEEREIFDFNVKNINWKDFYTNIHVPGLKTHVLKGRGDIPMPAKITGLVRSRKLFFLRSILNM